MNLGSPQSGSSSGAPVEHPPPNVPQYQLLRRIGGGSYGEVWLAKDVMGNYSAMKVVYRSRFTEDRPYEREFDGIRQFVPISRSHPSQVNILHAGLGEGFFYYAMELADDATTDSAIAPASNEGKDAGSVEAYEAKTLKWVLGQRGALPPAECLQIAIALTTALEHLHKNRLVHRDIKPSNIIFVNGLPKLADIGLVAEAGESCSFVGTEGFVPREGPGKPPADIFGLGRVLYEMMTGYRAQKYPALPEWADWPEHADRLELNQVVLRACHENVSRRYRTTEELHDDLRLLQNNKSLRRVRTLERAFKWLLLIVASLVGTVVIGGLAVGFWLFKNRAAQESRRADLSEGRVSRAGTRYAGWFDQSWSRLTNAAPAHRGADWQAQVLAVLAGLDAHEVWLSKGTSAGSVCFGPDDRVLVGGVQGGTGAIIKADGSKTPLPVRAEGPVWWAPDGTPRQFAAVTSGCAVLDMRTDRELRHFALAAGEAVRGKTGPLLTSSFPVLAATANGSYVAAAISGRVDRVKVWNGLTGEPSGEALLSAEALAFSPDGSRLAVGTGDGSIQIFSLPGLARVADLPRPARSIPTTCLALAPDRLVHYDDEAQTNRWLLAAGYQGGEVIVWDIHSRIPRSFCHGSDWNVLSLAFSPDGLTLASAGRLGTWLWDTMSGQLVLRIKEGSGDETRALAFNGSGTLLAWGTEQHGGTTPTVSVWELIPHRGIHSLRGLSSVGRRVWFSADNRLVAALSDDWHLAVWESRTDRLLWIFQVPVGEYADNAAGLFELSGARFVFAAGTEARAYDLATGRTLKKWELRPGLSDGLHFDAQQRLLLARREQGPGQRGLNWWRLYELDDSETPKLLHEQTETNWLTTEMFLPAGSNGFVVLQSDSSTGSHFVRAYDVTSGKVIWSKPSKKREPDMDWEQTGSWLAYQADESERYQLVRLSDFQVQTGYAPDGLRSLSSSSQQFALNPKTQPGWLIRDDRNGEQALPFGLDWAPGCDPVFSPDGRLLAWGTLERLIIVAELDEVKKRLTDLH